MKQSSYSGQNWSGNFSRQSSLDQGYYSGLDDKLTMRRLIKGFAYATIFLTLAASVLFVGTIVGF